MLQRRAIAIVRPAGIGLIALLAFVPHRPAEARPEFRFEVGLGVVYTDYDLTAETGLGPADIDLESDSALGGTGPLYSAGLWVDGLFAPNFTFGVEYLNGQTSSDVDVEVRAAGTTNRLDTEFRLETQSVFVNAAWRSNEGHVHPYLGGGLGGSWLDGRIRSDAATSALGGADRRIRLLDQDAFAPSAQILAGFDYDVTERFYVGIGGRFFLIDGRLFEQDQVIRELSAQARAGIRF